MAIVGIDLGTTNSLVVAYKHEEVVMIPNVYGEYLTPSVVSIDASGQIIVGKSAKERLVSHPDMTTSLFKRNMGTQKLVTLKDRSYLPEELSSFVVKQLIEDAKAYLQEDIDEIVISVPAYFNDSQRSATKRIGTILDVKVERLINEPSAASIACHYGKEEDESFIVFDFGGGTLDVSVVDCFDNVVSICAIAGNNALGGSDFDTLIALDFCKEFHIDFDQLTQQTKESLLYRCERAKIALQEGSPVLMDIHINGHDVSYELSDMRLKGLGKSLFGKMKIVIAEAVNNSGFSKGEIDKLVMVGGSCHMPMVIEFLQDLMNVEVYQGVEKDYMVAKGLGIYVGIKQRSSSIKNLVLTDICPFSLSTAVNNKENPMRPYSEVLIPKNSVLPAARMKYFATNKGQKEVMVDIYQGEGIYADQNTLLTSEIIKLPTHLQQEALEITFIYDMNSILCAEVTIVSTKKTVSIVVGDQMISRENIESIKNASMKLKLEPQLEYMEEQVERIMADSSIQTQEWLRERYTEFLVLMRKYPNNLRKRAILMKRMEKILSNVKEEMETCDVFKVDEDEETLEETYLS